MFELDDALSKSKDSSLGGDHIPLFLVEGSPNEDQAGAIKYLQSILSTGRNSQSMEVGYRDTHLEAGQEFK